MPSTHKHVTAFYGLLEDILRRLILVIGKTLQRFKRLHSLTFTCY